MVFRRERRRAARVLLDECGLHVLRPPHDRPLFSIEFDGIGGGFDRNGEYQQARRTSDPHRKLKMDFKLRVPRDLGYPLVVVSFEELEALDAKDSLTILDGIVARLVVQNRRMWLLAGESLASLLWVLCLAAALLIALLGLAISGHQLLGFGLAWGIAVAVLATIQVTVALWIDTEYDPRGWRAYLIEPIYPIAYWLISAAAALREQTVALVRGPEASAWSGTSPANRSHPRRTDGTAHRGWRVVEQRSSRRRAISLPRRQNQGRGSKGRRSRVGRIRAARSGPARRARAVASRHE